MPSESKISTAFESFLQHGDPADRREAIVLYNPPADAWRRQPPQPRGRLLELKQRLAEVKAMATAQQPAQDSFLRSVRRLGNQHVPKSQHDLLAKPIGHSGLPIATVEVTKATLEALAEKPDVVAVLPNERIRLIRPKAIHYGQLASQEAKTALTWGLKQLRVPEIWKKTKGIGVTVAVLDTGVHAEHPALSGRVKEFIVVDPLGRRISTSTPFDGDSHGTHVCGTIAGGQSEDGIAIGVAPEATLLVAGVLMGSPTVNTLLEGVSWAVEQGANIISMSLGLPYYEPKFDLIFEMLVNNYNVLPVAAIGNENHGNSSSPGNAPNALSVGAVEKARRGKTDVTFFSSGASLVFPGGGQGLVTKPDLVAPGAQVYSCIPPEQGPDGTQHYAYMDGTSMATPHVSGVAALLMSAHPSAPVADIIRVLKDTAKHPGGKANRPDNRWGHGLIDPVAALAALA